MSLIPIFAFSSAALGIYSAFPYIRSILNGKTKPHRLSWLVFSIMGFISFFSQFFEGGTASIVISLVFSINCLLIFVLSLKYGVSDTSPFDRGLFIFALCTIVIWYITRNNALAIWLTVIIDVCATSMTILKIKAHPASEDPFPWMLATIAYVFTVLTLIGKPVNILYVRPFYGLFSEFVVLWSIYHYRSKRI